MPQENVFGFKFFKEIFISVFNLIIIFLVLEFFAEEFFGFMVGENIFLFLSFYQGQPSLYIFYWVLDKILFAFNILPVYIDFFTFLIPLLLCVAFMTLVERKVLAAIQRRQGPHIVGYFGILQPFADGLKLFCKEAIIPTFSNYYLFFLAPVTSLFLSFMVWLVIPLDFGYSFMDINLAFLFILGMSSLGVYGIIVAGWSSNSKYAFLGSLRSAAQMISYEVSLGLIVLPLFAFNETFNFFDVLYIQRGSMWNIFLFFPLSILFFVSALAETNRSPFDLPEAEAELVSGYNVEYSGFGFAFFFIAEYLNIIFMCFIFSILFLGGTLPLISPVDVEFFVTDKFVTLLGTTYDFKDFKGPIVEPIVTQFVYLPEFFKFFSADIGFYMINLTNTFAFQPHILWLILKVYFVMWMFIAVRAIVPRYRYDQLMYLGWKSFLPLSLAFFLIYFSLFICFLNFFDETELFAPVVFLDYCATANDDVLVTNTIMLQGHLVELGIDYYIPATGEILWKEYPNFTGREELIELFDAVWIYKNEQ